MKIEAQRIELACNQTANQWQSSRAHALNHYTILPHFSMTILNFQHTPWIHTSIISSNNPQIYIIFDLITKRNSQAIFLSIFSDPLLTSLSPIKSILTSSSKGWNDSPILYLCCRTKILWFYQTFPLLYLQTSTLAYSTLTKIIKYLFTYLPSYLPRYIHAHIHKILHWHTTIHTLSSFIHLNFFISIYTCSFFPFHIEI